MRLFFLSGSDERPMLPHLLSVRDSSPDFREREDNLIRGCFFGGALNSRVGAVVMISGAKLGVSQCRAKMEEESFKNKQDIGRTGVTYVVVLAAASR